MPRKPPEPFDDALDGRRASILKHFRCGARRPWCRQIWKSAVEACGGTQDSAAQRLFVNTSAVSEGLQHGRLSMETLIVMMAELSPHGWRLPKLPSSEELMDEGLIEAMAFLVEPDKRGGNHRRISRDDLALLAAMLAEKECAKAAADADQARTTGDAQRLRRAEGKLTALADRIAATASRRRGCLFHCNAVQLRDLAFTWSAAWTECRDAIPFDWASR